MPKATLLGTPDATFHLGTPKRDYDFVAGIAQEVPVAIALFLGRKRARNKKSPLFLIEEMPEIVQPDGLEQNVVSANLHQPRFIDPWPLEQQ